MMLTCQIHIYCVIFAISVFPTGTKDSSVIGVDGLAALCASVRIPVVAIGE